MNAGAAAGRDPTGRAVVLSPLPHARDSSISLLQAMTASDRKFGNIVESLEQFQDLSKPRDGFQVESSRQIQP